MKTAPRDDGEQRVASSAITAGGNPWRSEARPVARTLKEIMAEMVASQVRSTSAVESDGDETLTRSNARCANNATIMWKWLCVTF